MTRLLVCILALFLSTSPARAAPDTLYLHPDYSTTRDPNADLAAGLARAKAEGKLVLLDVGGDWCVWCHILDKYLETHDDVRAAFAAAFVITKINYSTDVPNKEFLSLYPKVAGYPAFIILGADGALLGTQDTGDLEKGRSYNHAKMLGFAKTWKR
jgi:thiol:disulfide interchange protein